MCKQFSVVLLQMMQLSYIRIFFSVIIVSFCILSKYSFFGALWKHRWSQKGLIHGLSNVLKVKSSARCVCACPTVSFSWSD